MKHITEMIENDRINHYSPQVLAYVGDAVFELYVRLNNAATPYTNPKLLHSKTVKLVSAASQAELLKGIMPELTKEEEGVVRRGKNAKTNQSPKGSNYYEYRLATALEALIGYLYLKGREERILELLDNGLYQERGSNK